MPKPDKGALDSFLEKHEVLIPGSARRGAEGVCYGIRLPDLHPDRKIISAELLLPKRFPEHAYAKILLPRDTVLWIPHVEENCTLCTKGDPGPGNILTPEARIDSLLYAFDDFIKKWNLGELDGDLEKEAQNYWAIHVLRSQSPQVPVKKIWITDKRSHKSRVLEGVLFLPSRTMVVQVSGDHVASRLMHSLGMTEKQRRRVIVADISIGHNLTPLTWPQSVEDLRTLLRSRLSAQDLEKFSSFKAGRNRSFHKVVILRSPESSFGFLMPSGPSTLIYPGKQQRARLPQKRPIPLLVERLDPSWTEGRDQHPEIEKRQSSHVLVLGVGALGSYAVDHLAKAGVGCITVVDPDILVSANIGRHLLGVGFLGQAKATTVATYVQRGHPATKVIPAPMSAEKWLMKYGLETIDMVLDLTGEPDVRWHLDSARKNHPTSLVIGWMEPFVAAAHACTLLGPSFWFVDGKDRMSDLEAVDWPDEVIRREPGCSSEFQSYTASAAAYAVALVVERSLDVIDGVTTEANVVSWVRGQEYLNRHWPGLSLRKWAEKAAEYDGIVLPARNIT